MKLYDIWKARTYYVLEKSHIYCADEMSCWWERVNGEYDTLEDARFMSAHLRLIEKIPSVKILKITSSKI